MRLPGVTFTLCLSFILSFISIIRINDWLEKQKAEEEDKAKRKKEKLEKILNPPRHIVNDSTYVSEIKENAEKIDEALKQGMF